MTSNRWRLLSVVLAAQLLLWVSASFVRVENQRYAWTVGSCAPRPPHLVPYMVCLERVETRAGWWWHLYCALLP